MPASELRSQNIQGNLVETVNIPGLVSIISITSDDFLPIVRNTRPQRTLTFDDAPPFSTCFILGHVER